MFQIGKVIPLLLPTTLLLGACGDDAATVAQAMQDAPDLGGTSWQVEDIDATGVIDNTQVTIEIPEPTQVAGSSGCNRYFGKLTIGSEEFVVSVAGNTMRACPPAIEEQERRFLQALLDTRRYSTDGTVLHLYDEQGKARVRAIAINGKAASMDVGPADVAEPGVATEQRFDCGDALSTAVVFVGPETLQLTLPDGKHTLQRQRSASGAKYSGDGILFWNKGSEALLDIGGVEHHCVRAG